MVVPMTRIDRRLSSAKELATEQIRAMIYSGRIESEARISITELADSFGISRTPVRDALWQLASEGLVTVTPRVGVFVRKIEGPEILDVYEIKAQLEPLMAQWAIERSTSAQREQFYASLGTLGKAFQERHLEKYVACVEARRRKMLSMANSPVLDDELNVIDGRVRLLRRLNLGQPGSMEASFAQHSTIAEAVLAGDAKAGYEAMRSHMLDATLRVRSLFAST